MAGLTRSTKDDELEPKTVLVVGGGTMGSGIAQCFLERDHRVVLVEVDDAAAGRARARIAADLAKIAGRRGWSETVLQERVARLEVESDLAECRSRPDLAVESVPESPELKAHVLAGLSRHFPAAVIATNTSALSIDSLARHVGDPTRFAGMHFFNPVPRSSLVEVVRGAATSSRTLAVLHSSARSLGKTSIEVGDSPGFATSRLGIAIGLEAMRMVEEGVASPSDIDAGMVEGYKFPIGPLALSDLVGLDVRLAIADHLRASLGPRFEAPANLRAKVAAGTLGVKTGEGFYRYDAQTGRAENHRH